MNALKKAMSYGPVVEGPIRPWKEMSRLEKEINELPGYRELNRQRIRHYWTAMLWVFIPMVPAIWFSIKILRLMGLGAQ